jgi:GNAT superfamily N-acetyltransferase
MGNIDIRIVSTKKDLMKFIKMPWRIYKDDPHWVPPLIIDRKGLLDKKKNPFFKHAEMEMFLAYQDNEIVGRIAALTNDNYNKFQEDNSGFFGFYEAIDDPAVAKALFDKAENWLRDKGKDVMIGPFNPSTNDEAGLLIDGFNSPPYVMMCHNPAYYVKQCEDQGLEKARDLYAWYLDIRGLEIPSKLRAIAKRTSQKLDLTIRNINLKNLKEEVDLIIQIYNDAWSKNWGFVPLTEEEIKHLGDNLKQIADEEFILIAEKDGRPIGFSMTLLNINEITKNIPNGRLLPTGIFKLLTGMKKIRNVRVVTLGVIREFQHLGLGPIFYIETIERAQRRGLDGGEMSWVLEDNEPMNKAIELLGSVKHKTYRVYQKNL